MSSGSTFSSSDILAAIAAGRLRVGMRPWLAGLVHVAHERADLARELSGERSEARRGVVRLVLHGLMSDRPGLSKREAVEMTRRRAKRLPPFAGNSGPALAVCREEVGAWFAENRSLHVDVILGIPDDVAQFSTTARST